MRMRYDANMPSATYDQADYEALRRSNIPVTLSENPALRFDSALMRVLTACSDRSTKAPAAPRGVD